MLKQIFYNNFEVYLIQEKSRVRLLPVKVTQKRPTQNETNGYPETFLLNLENMDGPKMTVNVLLQF